MSSVRYREEVFNVVLARLLHERGVVSAPEQILKQKGDLGRAMPDVLVTFQGLTTAIEGKTEDAPSALEAVEGNARNRVEQGLTHMAVAVLYPAELRGEPWGQLEEALANCALKVCVFSEGGSSGWVEGNLEQLIEVLRRSYQQLVEEDVLARAVAVLNEAVESFAGAVLRGGGSVTRTAEALGIASAEEPGNVSAAE